MGRSSSRYHSHIKRLQKTLEGADINLDSIIAGIVGNSDRVMIHRPPDGATVPGLTFLRTANGHAAGNIVE
jgi:hypothetical protein